MDYKRIYDELMEHRKMLPKIEGEYYESHHILPRSMGGEDSEENLIDLTAEDHFMAHVLLAKAYGGKMWYAAQLMTRLCGNGRITHRHTFALVRKEWLKMMSGAASPSASSTIHTIYNLETELIENLTQIQIREKYGLTYSKSSRLVNEGVRTDNLVLYSVFLEQDNLSGKYYNFVNIQTGEVERTSASKLALKHNINICGIYDIISGRSRTHKGFRVQSDSPLPARHVKHCFVNIETGEEVVCTRGELYQLFGVPRSSITALFAGRVSRARNFVLSSSNYSKSLTTA